MGGGQCRITDRIEHRDHHLEAASTELAERLGDERWTDLLRWHRATTETAAAANRGYAVKSLGDGFMIAFPSATDGIRCASELQREIGRAHV